MKSHCHAVIFGEFTIKLTEAEARALEAISGYNSDHFITFFYRNMGKHYLEPHEEGLKSLFRDIQKILKPQLARVTKARKAFNEEIK